MTSPRPIRRSLDSTLSRLSQVSSSSSPSSSKSTSFYSPFSPSKNVRRRDSLDSLYSTSSFCSYGTVTSPQTRWPSSRTPRRRRPLESINQSILDTTVSSLDESCMDESTVSSRSVDCLNDSGFHDDIFRSPPVNKSAICQTSLLRTPTNDVLRQRTANSAFLASANSPSPLRSFKIREVSHISSSVSRTGGSTLMRFSGADVSGSHLVHLGKSEPVQPIQKPVLQQQKPSRLSPTCSIMRDIKVETPSKGYADDEDDELFSIASSSMMRMRDIPEITSGPIESSLFPFADSSYFTPLESSTSMDEEDTCDGFDDDSDDEEEEEETSAQIANCSRSVSARPSILQHGLPVSTAPSTSSSSLAVPRQPLADLQQNSLKRRADEGWKSGVETKKFNQGADLDRPVAQIIAEDVKPDLNLLRSSKGASESVPATKQKLGFRTPKKPFKTYSKRWWQVCTGSTQDSRTITSQAHAFLRRFGGDSAPSTILSAPSIKEESFFDSDVHFAPYLSGLDISYTAPEDPLNYQPPPLLYRV